VSVIWLVRHGQASWGAADYDVLSDLGRTQSRIAGETLASLGVRPALLAAGSMRRQHDTATEMAAAAGWALPVTTVAGFDEFDHGHLVERHPEQGADFATTLLDSIHRWIGGTADADYHETFPEFLDRVRSGLDEVQRLLAAGPGPGDPVTNSAEDPLGGHAVIATSGGAIGAVAAQLLLPDADPLTLGPVWLRLNWVLANASLTRVHVSSSRRGLITFNEHAHLPGNLRTHR
jgi:broad specificity phosphatase PhoE